MSSNMIEWTPRFGPDIVSPEVVTFIYLSYGCLLAGRIGEGCRPLDHETDPFSTVGHTLHTEGNQKCNHLYSPYNLVSRVLIPLTRTRVTEVLGTRLHSISSACASLVHVHSRNVIRVREVETFPNKRKTVLRCLTSLLLPFLLPCYPFVSPNKVGVGTQIFLILSVSSQ